MVPNTFSYTTTCFGYQYYLVSSLEVLLVEMESSAGVMAEFL